jgi:alpha,alpha-trehalase
LAVAAANRLWFPADEQTTKSRKFLVNVEETMKAVLAQEDTDGNFQIHSTDKGPKVFSLGTASSNGHNSFDVSRLPSIPNPV